MFPDLNSYGQCLDPFICRRGRIIIIYTPVSGIPAVQRIPGGLIRGIIRRQIYLPVGNHVKSACLVYDASYRLWEATVFNPVQYDSGYGHLAGVRFPSALPIHGSGQQIQIRSTGTAG